MVARDLGGAATLRMKAAEFGLEIADAAVGRALEDLKERESRGYTFEVADASLELLMRRAGGWAQAFFASRAIACTSRSGWPTPSRRSPRPP